MLDGEGSLRLGGDAHALEPESGAYLAPGEEYAVANTGDRAAEAGLGPDPRPGRRPAPPEHSRRPWSAGSPTSSPSRRPPTASSGSSPTPSTGLRSATHFVGYIPTARAPEHFHTYNEVIYVLDGEGVMHAEGNDWQLRPGTCIQLPARVVHCLENTGGDVMRVVAVFRPAGSPAAAYYPDGTPAHPAAPSLSTQSEPDSEGSPEEEVEQ